VIDRNPREFAFVENDKRTPLYFIAVASDADRAIEETGSALIDVSDALLKSKDVQIAAHVKEQERLIEATKQLMGSKSDLVGRCLSSLPRYRVSSRH
jgi:hypothetical protein